ncbi:3-methyl-2-oxobutanoate hydroxymethyltransferase [Kocuria palustris]|uniref:3-methyl-2-oxobutanoate hydroxymethyltransferase n=1 Tax=Kocuria palustris TaxID=71999 RepID=UPI0011A8EF2A|nr:3-methyl-2-oxobutanoate hydroxymethyltransferase [Kocuria palustris]
MSDAAVPDPPARPAETAPYGTGPSAGAEARAAASGLADAARVRTRHLQQAKDAGERFTMLTAYDATTAGVFDEAGIDTLLVGDSAGSTVFGESSTLPVTLEQMIALTAAVSRAARRALVLADVPFGSYEESPQQAVRTAVRLLKEGGAHAVKIEADASLAEHVSAVVRAGIPVMAHVGFTPQSEHALGGYRIQGRGEAARKLVDDALALQEAGAFAVLLEMVPAQAAAEVDEALDVPTVGIGAGGSTTGQVLVWQDMLGLSGGRVPRFVKQYADLRATMAEAVGRYASDVRDGSFPGPEHTY